jgi:4'-phosphopantetheinyl transferase
VTFLDAARFAVEECNLGTPMDCLNNSRHLWWISLPSFQKYQPQLFQTLSPRERDHGSQFKSPLARDRYTITRAVLRILLSHYARQAPATISILATPSGKPFATGERMPAFSVSHSADVAVIALAPSPLGVDVESIHEIPEMLAIAKQFFSAREYRHLIALPTEHRKRAFFAAWTEKEAYLKATGEGLAGLPADTDLSPHHGLSDSVSKDRCGRWQPSRFERENYAVAIVASPYLGSLTLNKFVPELLGQMIGKDVFHDAS